MTEPPFACVENAAESIDCLTEYLRSEDNGGFLYRGQTRDYGSPLLPSTFRNNLDPMERYRSNSPEFAHRMRGVGASFVGNYARSRLVPRATDWEDRTTIRQRFLNVFGYILGSALAQHYGLQSEHLDVTTDIDVAAFFATHDGPAYSLYQPSRQAEEPFACGVIYRFHRVPFNADVDGLKQIDYFTAPGTLVHAHVLRLFEANVSISESLDSIRGYYELRRATGERNLRLIKLPANCLKTSRIGRQGAAVIIPDEIHISGEEPVYESHPIFRIPVIRPGNEPLVLESIEDIGSREGTDVFYFRHTGREGHGSVRAESLWPNDIDHMLRLVALLLSNEFDSYAAAIDPVPARFELIDPGLGSINAEGLVREWTDFARGESEDVRTIRYASWIESQGMKLTYFRRKAAALCYRAHITSDAALMQASLAACANAIKIDPESVVLNLLKNLGHYALGEYAQAQAALGCAMIAGGDEIQLVQQIQKDLYVLRFSDRFPELFEEYYQCF